MGLLGSAYFLQSNLFPKDQIKFNINLDMIGRTGKGNEKTRAHYAVTDKKYVQAIGDMIKEVNQGITDFPILIDDDEHSPGGSDHMTFIQAGIPAFFFFSGVHADLHTPGDDPDKIDYPKAEKVTRLAYLIAEKLANLSVVPDFK
jgi:Zn-dependent M28 family amino/carboxypeptidase